MIFDKLATHKKLNSFSSNKTEICNGHVMKGMESQVTAHSSAGLTEAGRMRMSEHCKPQHDPKNNEPHHHRHSDGMCNHGNNTPLFDQFGAVVGTTEVSSIPGRAHLHKYLREKIRNFSTL